MYIPRHFEVTDKREILAFIAANAFGQLVSRVGGRLFSTHLPFLLDERGSTLLAHVAKQNPQHQEIHGQEALVTFQGPHAYISPSWYEGPGVPTWNYQAVHVYGRCEVFDDSTRLAKLVAALTGKYEQGFTEPWFPQYPQGMLGAIVGIEITIDELQCKYKLSQNRPAGDRQQVIRKLGGGESEALAEAMRRNEA